MLLLFLTRLWQKMNHIFGVGRGAASTGEAVMTKQAFPDVSTIKYEGPQSKNPLAFKHYNATEKIDGKPMRDHLRFGVAYWHTMRNVMSDPFGVGTAIRPWDDGSASVANAQNRARAAFEFIEKL